MDPSCHFKALERGFQIGFGAGSAGVSRSVRGTSTLK